VDLLDVGCGPGTITVDMAAIVAPGRTTGIDTAHAVINEARRLRSDVPVEFKVADVMTGDVPSGPFDLVHAHQVLQHLGDPVAALRQMARLCRPGGIVAARDSDYEAMTWFPGDLALDAWLDLYRMADAWRRWKDASTGWFAVLHGEIVCRAARRGEGA